jgi:hypothetical protein
MTRPLFAGILPRLSLDRLAGALREQLLDEVGIEQNGLAGGYVWKSSGLALAP